MTQEYLFNLARTKLVKLAKENKIKNYGRLTKQQLIEELLAANNPKQQKLASAPHPVQKPVSEQKQTTVPVYQKEEQVTDTKYYVGNNPIAWEAQEELPANYGDVKIVLLVRDPYWLYAYWEINQERFSQAQRDLHSNLENCRSVMRVYDVTDRIFDGTNANSYFDIEVNGASAWYIKVPTPDRSYCADMGLITPDGFFYVLARSNPIITPRDTPSMIFNEIWMTRKPGEFHIPGAYPFRWEQQLYKPLQQMGSEFVGSFSKRL